MKAFYVGDNSEERALVITVTSFIIPVRENLSE